MVDVDLESDSCGVELGSQYGSAPLSCIDVVLWSWGTTCASEASVSSPNKQVVIKSCMRVPVVR